MSIVGQVVSGTRVPCVCDHCGASFSVQAAQVRLRGGGKYCSKPCRWAGTGERRRGALHHNWKGDDVSPMAARARARTRYVAERCERCDATEHIERHHKNGNTHDNSPENIAILCRRCHMHEDGRLYRFRDSVFRLTDEQVAEIQARYAALPRVGSRRARGSVSALAAELGVSRATIIRWGSQS